MLYKEDMDVYLDIHYAGIMIHKVDEMKYLGLMIDMNLTWKSHINYLCKKLSILVGIFKKISYILPNRVKKTFILFII